jgi:hypothetical protein
MTTLGSPTCTVPVRCATAILHSCQRAHACWHTSCMASHEAERRVSRATAGAAVLLS